jgi:His/Glu/Gln/Arg/opine family amino acid ABC transporter permease subunit
MGTFENSLLLLMLGAWTALRVTAGALAVAIVLGLALGAAAASGQRVVRAVIFAYVEFFRTIPALTLLFAIYFGLPAMGILVDSIPAAIIGLGLMGGAYLCEVFRAGLGAIRRGQREAARSVGMTPFAVLAYIVLPQTWRIVLPPIGSYAIMLLKDTSVASAIAAPEIMFYARQLVNNTLQTTAVYVAVAAIYLVLSLSLARVTRWLERWSRAGT